MMKEEQKLIGLDEYEEGAIISGLNELRSKEIAEQEPTDFVDDLMLKILHTRPKKVRVRDEAR
jgi:hypothetical protein